MNGAGFDWLNTAALKSDSDLPPPPVSFGFTPTSSSSSLNLAKDTQLLPITKHTTDSKLSLNNPDSPVLEETSEDLTVPLSLSGEQLTREEAKTYLRWYNDIVVRRGTSLIRLHDVFNFLKNLNLSSSIQKLLERIFRDCVSLNIGEFFAVLRIISHVLLGEAPRRRLIKIPAPTVKPKSILSAKRQKESNDDDYENDDDANEQLPVTIDGSTNNTNEPSKFDLDSFTQFILTGERPEDKKPTRRKKKHSKRVKFSDQISVEPTELKEVEPVKIDLSLPMDQLLNKIPKPHHQEQPQQINEEEELKEMQDQFNHFQNVKNVDSALIHGVPANIPSIFFDEAAANENGFTKADILAANDIGPVKLMSPNHTGPGPALSHFNSLTPNFTGSQQHTNGYLSPNRTGPSPQQFAEMLSPHATGSTETDIKPLAPSMTGSLSNAMRQNLGPPVAFPSNEFRVSSASPIRNVTPPVPPQRRARSVSSPIPFDQSNPQQQQQPSLQPIYASEYQQQQQQPIHQQYQKPQLSNPTLRVTSPLPPPPPPPARRNRGISLPAPPPPPSRNAQQQQPQQQQYPPVPQRVASDQGPLTSQSSVYDRVLQDFTTNGAPINQNYPYLNNNDSNSSSTADILGDLKALQSEVDRLQSFHN